jgi:hypothetical protein
VADCQDDNTNKKKDYYAERVIVVIRKRSRRLVWRGWCIGNYLHPKPLNAHDGDLERIFSSQLQKTQLDTKISVMEYRHT